MFTEQSFENPYILFYTSAESYVIRLIGDILTCENHIMVKLVLLLTLSDVIFEIAPVKNGRREHYLN